MTTLIDEMSQLLANRTCIYWQVDKNLQSEDIVCLLNKANKICNQLYHIQINGIKGKYALEAAEYLSQLLNKNPAVAYVDLGDNEFGDAGLEKLIASFKHCSQLEHLALFNTGLTNHSISLLSSFLKSQISLRCLNVGNNKFNIKGLKILLKNLHKDKNGIESLHLNGYPLNNESMTTLSYWLRLSAKTFPPINLRHLYLNHTDIDDNTIKILAESLIFDPMLPQATQLQLHTLALDNNRIQNTGIITLAKALEAYSPLSQISLKNNPFHQAGAKTLLTLCTKLSEKSSLRRSLESLIQEFYDLSLTSAYQNHHYDTAAFYLRELQKLSEKNNSTKYWASRLEIANNLQQVECEEELLQAQLQRLRAKKKQLILEEERLDKSDFINISEPVHALQELINTENIFFNTLEHIANLTYAIPHSSPIKKILYHPLAILANLENLIGTLGQISTTNFHEKIIQLRMIIHSDAFANHYAQLLVYSELEPSIEKAIKFFAKQISKSKESALYDFIINILFIGEGLALQPIQRIMRYEMLIDVLVGEYRKFIASKHDETSACLEEISQKIKNYVAVVKSMKQYPVQKRQEVNFIFQLLTQKKLVTAETSLAPRSSILLNAELADLLQDLTLSNDSSENPLASLSLNENNSYLFTQQRLFSQNESSRRYRKCISALYSALQDERLTSNFLNDKTLDTFQNEIKELWKKSQHSISAAQLAELPRLESLLNQITEALEEPTKSIHINFIK